MIRECEDHGYFRAEACPFCGDEGKFIMSDFEVEKIGRTLAGILRHGKYGVEIDSQGYADIRDVLAKVKEKNPRMKWLRTKHLEALITTDPKGRYEISGNSIRATYGHTIELDLDLDNEGIPEELFYPASEEEAELLMESGIRPTDRSMVHLSLGFKDAYRAGSVRMDDPVVLVIDTGLCIEEGYDIGRAAKTVFLCREVPADAIMVAEPEDYDFEEDDERMVTVLTPDKVEEKYGRMFCRGLYTLVDEENGIAQVLERCSAQGPAEWDIMNRRRSGGVINVIRQESGLMVMDTVIGERELNFGPAAQHVGGQGLAALKVEGDEVRTTWYGIAGAGVGIGACLPGCKDVIRTEYPDDFAIGGAHAAHVDIITPKLVRVIIGVDDTDTKEKGASWVASLKLGMTCPVGHFLGHKIIQLNPLVPNKTTNCCSTAVAFAVKESEIPALVEYATEFIRKESYSEDSVITVFKGLKVPEKLAEFGWSCKSVLYTQEDAIKAAGESGVQIISVTGMKGVIGAVAAIGCYDMGEKAAGIAEDFQ